MRHASYYRRSFFFDPHGITTHMAEPFSGSVKSGAISTDFIPYAKSSCARILLSIPIKVCGETLSVIKTRQMGANYGDPDVTAVAYSMFCGAMDVLMKDSLVQSRITVVDADCYASRDCFNIQLEINGQVGKALNVLKLIARGLKPSYAIYSGAMKNLFYIDDAKHGAAVMLSPSRVSYNAAVNMMIGALKNIHVLFCGKVIIKASSGKSGIKSTKPALTPQQRIMKKVKEADETLRELERSSEASLSKFPSMPANYKFSRKAKSAMDFFALDLIGGYSMGATIVFDRNPDLAADKKKAYAEKLANGLKENLEAACAFNAVQKRGFSASEIATTFGKKISEKAIVDAI